MHLKEKQPLEHLQRPGLTWLYRSWSFELHSLYTSVKEWQRMCHYNPTFTQPLRTGKSDDKNNLCFANHSPIHRGLTTPKLSVLPWRTQRCELTLRTSHPPCEDNVVELLSSVAIPSVASRKNHAADTKRQPTGVKSWFLPWRQKLWEKWRRTPRPLVGSSHRLKRLSGPLYSIKRHTLLAHCKPDCCWQHPTPHCWSEAVHTQTAKKKGTIPKFNPRGALSLPLASVGTNPGSMSAISLMFRVSPKLCGIDSKTTVSPWQNEACSEQARCCQRRNPMAHNPLEASARAGPPLAGPRAETYY